MSLSSSVFGNFEEFELQRLLGFVDTNAVQRSRTALAVKKEIGQISCKGF